MASVQGTIVSARRSVTYSYQSIGVKQRYIRRYIPDIKC